MSDILDNFSCLDELTQVIYQSVDRFVVFSSVSHSSWDIHLGLSGSEGRWWHGSWKELDIVRLVGPKPSDVLLETFAEKLAESFIQGEIYVGDWSTEKGANINLTFGSTAKKPMHVDLVEMSASDAAAYATTVFLDIALQAQSRKCRLHPPSVEYATTTTPADPTPSRVVREPDNLPGPITLSRGQPQPSASGSMKPATVILNKASHKVETQATKDPKRTVSPPTKPAPRALKGASLANPNKKARKYQAIEFESDEE